MSETQGSPGRRAVAERREPDLEDLEWSRVERAVAARCVGPLGRTLSLTVAAEPDGARRALAETTEAWNLLEAGEPLPLDGVRDVRAHLARLERQGALDGSGLRDVQLTLAAARALRRFLGRRKEQAPHLHEACVTDPSLDRLAEEIGAAIEVDGRIADDASPDLRKLRTEVANLRGRLVSRLESLIEKRADILQERYYTIREGRYVLPVRTDAHEKLPGIVHGTSASGASVYVEPRQLVEQGNRLKMAHAQMEREETRLLGLLSDLVRERAAEVRAAADALDHADLRSASAKLGRDLGCSMVELVDAPRIELRAARHPLLELDQSEVIANDVELAAGRALVISGPNAGGKTVALKVLGLAALMVRAGLPFPCESGSRCGFFDPVLADVGDHQSIEANLSTFSAHVTNLARILRHAREHALVLLDELAGSTDPQEGAALACAIVDALCGRGVAVAVTTHYEPLKAFGASDERLRNASVGFDVQRMAPTFRLRLDVPGSSSALAVASRFGIAPDIVKAAEAFVPEETHEFESLARKLEAQADALDAAREGVETERREHERAKAELEERSARLRERERHKLGEEAEKLLTSVRQARSDVETARKQLRRERMDEQRVREARDAADAAARTVSEAERFVETGQGTAADASAAPREPETGTETGTEVDPAALTVGERVWVRRFRAEAEVLEVTERGKLRVAAGALKVWVDPSDIEPLGTSGDNGGRRGAGAGPRRGGGEPEPRPEPEPEPKRDARPPSSDNTVDVRGMRVDEAVAMTEQFVDRLYGGDEPVGYIVHGVGTGALREAIRERLSREATYVQSVRSGTPKEGGERVTVVYLR